VFVMTENEVDENEESLDELFVAMKKAKKAFEKHFEDLGIEGAYFKLELKGYVLDSEFHKWKELKLSECD